MYYLSLFSHREMGNKCNLTHFNKYCSSNLQSMESKYVGLVRWKSKNSVMSEVGRGKENYRLLWLKPFECIIDIYIQAPHRRNVFRALSLCECAWQAVYKWMPLVLATDVFWLAGGSINQALGSSEAQRGEIEVFCLGQSAVCPCWLTICQTGARFSVLLTLTGGSII